MQDCYIQIYKPLQKILHHKFFEHLPNKSCLSTTLGQAFKTLKIGGKLIAIRPNIRFLTAEYWDFYDHHVIPTEKFLAEALEIAGFQSLKNHA